MSDNNLKSLTVQGVELAVKVPYSEGHVLNVAEASVLNQTFVENIRNNTAAKVKKAKKELTAKVFAAWKEANPEASEDDFNFDVDAKFEPSAELLAEIQDYANSYEFGIIRQSTLEPLDPVEKEALKIAKEFVNTQLRAKGYKIKDIPDDKLDVLYKAKAEQPGTIEAAKQRLAIAAQIGDEEMDLSGLLAPATEGDTEVTEEVQEEETTEQ